jgi:hypothetical protein
MPNTHSGFRRVAPWRPHGKNAGVLRHLLLLPRARRWVQATIAAHVPLSRIAESRLERLQSVCSNDLLMSVRLVVVEHVPQPPLERWGFDAGSLPRDAAGITLNQMIFVRRGLERDESLVFHELVHALQWRALGVNRFLALYGMLMLECGYRESALETMAYDLQADFEARAPLPEVEQVVRRRTQELFAALQRRSVLHRLVFGVLR